MSDLTTIIEQCEVELVIKKSKFITRLYKVQSIEQATEYIELIKRNEKGARHNCYAYRILDETNIVESRNDDGEPGGTAGAPMLAVLTGNSLVNVLAITTRYFGGTKLGTGGLVRAYSDGVKEAFAKSGATSYKKYNLLLINFPVQLADLINNYLIRADISIEDKVFLDQVNYKVLMTDLQKNEFENMFLRYGNKVAIQTL